MLPEDWPFVRAIFLEGIETKQATFETAVPSWSEWNAARHADCRLVARLGGQVIGWTALNPVSSRVAYAGVAEVGIYVTKEKRGRGVGRMLLEALIRSSEEVGIWTLQASVFPENESSIHLFKSCGFRQVGYRDRIAWHEDRWRNTLLFERRSDKVGI
jgi:L-amino acid N-acyltransferase YncA